MDARGDGCFDQPVTRVGEQWRAGVGDQGDVDPGYESLYQLRGPRDKIVELAFERGVLLLGCGANTVRVAAPLIVTKEQADIEMDVLEECIGIVEKGSL